MRVDGIGQGYMAGSNQIWVGVNRMGMVRVMLLAFNQPESVSRIWDRSGYKVFIYNNLNWV